MATRLPLGTMSVEEKLQEMESLWNDLCARAESVPSPDWHGEVLAERQAAIDAGQEHFEDWEVAKEKIRKQIS